MYLEKQYEDSAFTNLGKICCYHVTKMSLFYTLQEKNIFGYIRNRDLINK